MSDQDSASGEPEENESGPVRPRHQRAAERRSSETVMLNADSLDDLMAQAKAQPGEAAAEAPAEPAAPAAEPAPAAAASAPASEASDDAAGSSRQMLLIAGVIVVIILAFVIAWI